MSTASENLTAAAPASPRNAGLVVTSLILVAAVANLNLSVANVALPSIGAHFDSGQTTLDLIAVGYSLGLACSVLWLGALGDRYGRKSMLPLAVLVFFCFPKAEREKELLARYHAEDVDPEAAPGPAPPEPAAPLTT